MLGQLTALFVAANGKKGKRPKPSDFMLSELLKKEASRPLSESEMLKAQLMRYQAQRDREKAEKGEK